MLYFDIKLIFKTNNNFLKRNKIIDLLKFDDNLSNKIEKNNIDITLVKKNDFNYSFNISMPFV